MIPNLLSGIAAKLSAAGIAAKAGVGLTMAAASVAGVAATGVLPDPVQHAVASVISDVTPFEFPDEAGDRADFGQDVSVDARDDEPGVDGTAVSEDAKLLGEEHRPDVAGQPEAPGSRGLDQAGQTPAAAHLPAAVPAGLSTADQYRQDPPAASQPEGAPSGAPEGAPTGAPEGTPTGRR